MKEIDKTNIRKEYAEFKKLVMIEELQVYSTSPLLDEEVEFLKLQSEKGNVRGLFNYAICLNRQLHNKEEAEIYFNKFLKIAKVQELKKSFHILRRFENYDWAIKSIKRCARFKDVEALNIVELIDKYNLK